jgi:alpha-L-fucosidase
MLSKPTSRRGFLTTAAVALASCRAALPELSVGGTRRPRPSAAQLLWQMDERALFLHFGLNTFTDREWGDGREDPALFNPSALDARQWARAARESGFRAMVLTAKHHDGFCLWPTRTTPHSVARSPWREGRGDVVREFVNACSEEGLRAGLYCSPWDRNHPAYGDSPRYNDVFCDQLTELLTSYGPIHEVWFDGANGEGPNGRRQEYDFPRFWSLVKRLQPNAVIFSDAGPDVRWIGNERGVAGETNWSTVDPTIVTVPGMSGAEVMRSLQQGDREGSVWRPGETDVSIRPGWFYHPAEDSRVKSVEQLVDLFFTSVGRNSKLLLNVPPTREGVLHATDVERLRGMQSRLQALFRDDLTSQRRPQWKSTGAKSGTLEIGLLRTVNVSVADLREDIRHGQLVARYVLEGTTSRAWDVLARGTTIGYRKLERFTPREVRRVRLTIEDAVAPLHALDMRLYSGT